MRTNHMTGAHVGVVQAGTPWFVAPQTTRSTVASNLVGCTNLDVWPPGMKKRNDYKVFEKVIIGINHYDI